MWRRILVKYPVEISDLPLFSSRDVCKNKDYRIIGEKQCHSVSKSILFEITRMQSVNRGIAALSFFFSHESTKGKARGSPEKMISSSD